MSSKPDPPTALTRPLIDETSDDLLESMLLDYVLGLQKRAPDRLDTLPEACQAHVIAFVMDGEVLNGGFNQFWFNCPEFATDAATALDFLEMSDAAGIARQASQIFETVREQHVAARQDGSIEAFMKTYEGQQFREVDAAYWARESEWRDARIAYIRRHVELFVHL